MITKENKDSCNCEKDWCDCFKEHMKKVKKEWRDKTVNDTLKFLNKNNIKFIDSNMSNIVILNPKTDKVFLSLKKKNKLYKCRFNGSNKWYLFSEGKLLKRFSLKSYQHDV